MAFPVLQMHGNLLSKRQVVLSFDDGPNNDTSPMLLDVLRRHGISALFFHVGVNINERKLMHRFMQEGHCVGVHTMHHAHLTTLSLADAKREIDDAVQVFHNVTGEHPYFFRPPYGEISGQLIEYTNLSGMASFKWDYDSSDWKIHHDLASQIGGKLHTHGILLLHEYPWTTEQAESIIQTIMSHGFDIVHPLELFDHAQLNDLHRHACPSDVQKWCDYIPHREKLEL